MIVSVDIQSFMSRKGLNIIRRLQIKREKCTMHHTMYTIPATKGPQIYEMGALDHIHSKPFSPHMHQGQGGLYISS